MNKMLSKIFYKLGYEIKNIPSNKKSILSDKLSYHETITGNYFLPADAVNDCIALDIKANKIFDENIYNLAKTFIKPGTTVLDVGSNFGQMAILFSNLVGDKGKVYAFDAANFVFQILVKNINSNNKKNIIPTFGAVHNVLGEYLFFPEPDFNKYDTYCSFGIDYKNAKGRKVPTVTIDSLNIPKPISFMKVDVQGGDLFALQGAMKTIEENKMPILFEYEYLFENAMPHNFQDYVDFVSQINYKFVKVIDGQNYLILPK